MQDKQRTPFTDTKSIVTKKNTHPRESDPTGGTIVGERTLVMVEIREKKG